MAHVQIRTGSATENGAPVQVLVDGVDLTWHIAAEGFEIHGLNNAAFEKPVVKMQVVCDSLDVDLPESVLKALAMRAGS